PSPAPIHIESKKILRSASGKSEIGTLEQLSDSKKSENNLKSVPDAGRRHMSPRRRTKMEFHVGRLIDHVHLRVADLERSRSFYRSALAALGREITHDGDGFFASDELFVDKADDYTTRVHLAFQA